MYASTRYLLILCYRANGLLEICVCVEQSGVNHPGPAQAYLAKAPNGDLENFSGYDGDWFKIALLGAKTDTEWVVQEYDHRVVSIQVFPGQMSKTTETCITGQLHHTCQNTAWQIPSPV